MFTVPWWFIFYSLYAVRMVSDEYVAPFLGFPFSWMFCGYISRYNLTGTMFPWAPVSSLALSDALSWDVVSKSMLTVTNTSSLIAFA